MRKKCGREDFGSRPLGTVKAWRLKRQSPRQAKLGCRSGAVGEAGPEIIGLEVLIRTMRNVLDESVGKLKMSH